MEITIKITTEHGTYEMTGSSEDQFDGWQVEQNNAGSEASNVANKIADVVFGHFDK